MKRYITFILAGFFVLFHLSLQGQSMTDLRLNEMLIINTNDYQDNFGEHSGWFEIFNTGYGTVDIGGCYLSNDPGNLKMYTIPRGDILTKIKPRQHILFWADNKPNRGSFHVNFTLAESKVLILTSSDGSSILDKVTIPDNLNPDQSFGRLVDGEGSYGTGSDNTGWGVLSRTSPSTNNHSLDGLSRSEQMKETDPFGWILAVMAMSVVFSSLVLLFLVFKGTGKIALRWSQKKADAFHKNKSKKVSLAETSGETFAAISMALHLYANETEVHDIENTILTIEQVRRNYSPWSSKFHSMRRPPIMRKK